MKASLKILSVKGIPIYIHWSFSLLVAYMVYLGFQQQFDVIETLLLLVLLMVSFFCVTLHELGHAFAARHYGFITKDITLLPIGGLARMGELPKKPIQELVVAIAGPMVNVAIAVVLGLVILLAGWTFETNVPNGGYLRIGLAILWWINVTLVVFNMIPAFPMDGGRVLRALLSIRFSRLRATMVASYLGRFLAVVFFLVGFGIPPFDFLEGESPVLALIGVFIFFSARKEYEFTKIESRTAGVIVRDFLLTEYPYLTPQQTLADSRAMVGMGFSQLPVKDEWGQLLGLLSVEQLKNALAQGKGEMQVRDIMDAAFFKLRAEDPVKNIFFAMRQKRLDMLPVYESGRFIGMVRFADIQGHISGNRIKKAGTT